MRRGLGGALVYYLIVDWTAVKGRIALDAVEILKVSANSNPKSVAGALAAVIREKGMAELQAVGAGAVNQAAKALAIAHGYLLGDGIDLVCIPHFIEIEIDGQERTALRFSVEARPAHA